MTTDSDEPEFQLSKINLIIATVWYVIVATIRLYALTLRVQETNILFKIVQVLGSTLGLMWIIYMIGWVFYRLFRRNQKAGNIAFFVVLLCWITLLAGGAVSGFTEGYSKARDRSMKERNGVRSSDTTTITQEHALPDGETTGTTSR